VTMTATSPCGTPAARPRAQDVDRHVGARLRELRVAAGLSQSALADLIGVTYQQAHKYESGVNRISASRLFALAVAPRRRHWRVLRGDRGSGVRCRVRRPAAYR
jgi:DNA-binding XRE family transcriptional regulator